MQKESIINRQAIAVIILCVIATSYVNLVSSEAKRDIWVALVFGFIISVPIFAIYARINVLFPGKNIYEIVIELFGKTAGKIIGALYVWYAFFISTLVTNDIAQYINITSLIETPPIMCSIVIVLLVLWLVRSGPRAIANWGMLLLPIIIAIVAFQVIILVPKLNLLNIRPILYNNWGPVLKTSIYLASMPYLEIVLFISLLCNLKSAKNIFGVYFKGVFVAMLITVFISFTNISVLGAPLYSKLYFPSYSAVTVNKINSFLQRAELLITAFYYFSAFTKITVSLYVACIGIAKIFEIEDYKKIVAPTALLMLGVSGILFKNLMSGFEFMSSYSVYSIPFQVIMPLIIWITGEIVVRRKKKHIQEQLAG